MRIGYDIQIEGHSCSRPFESDNGVLQNSQVQWHEPSGMDICLTQSSDGRGRGKLHMEIRNTDTNVHTIGSIYYVTDISEAGSLDYFTSDWGVEFEPCSVPVQAFECIEVTSGRSSKGYSPWIGCEIASGSAWISDSHALDNTHNRGCEIASESAHTNSASASEGAPIHYRSIALAWSGNWTITRRNPGHLHIGMDEKYFQTELKPGEAFQMFDIYYSEGIDSEHAAAGLRQYFFETDALIKKEGWQTLPVTYNTWWCYEDKLLGEDICIKNAQLAAEAGVTNFMLDAGWFGGNRKDISWFEKRGDWGDINTLDFPGGMASLGSRIMGTGLSFGIWCEIEAIGEFAKLADIHPEFLARRDGRRLGYLCMADENVRRWALGHIGRLVEEYHARWIKFDFNLDPELGCNETGHGHGLQDGLYAHYIGYYQLLDDIHNKYPDVVLENCSSGGLRIDLGILQRTHFTFLSDPDYVEHHFQCFWGATSFVHPACCYHFTQSECLGDHNGVQQPIYEGMPMTTFDYIIRSGMLCQIGLSYDLPKWPKVLLERLNELLSFYKQISGKYILNGKMFRLCRQAKRGGQGDRWQAYQYCADDNSSLLFVFRLPGAGEETVIHPENIRPENVYIVQNIDTKATEEITGSALIEKGLRISGLSEESSAIWLLHEKN